MKRLFYVLVVLVLFTCFIQGKEKSLSNNPGVNIDKKEKVLLAEDREISNLSTEKGILNAFYPFLTEQSIILPTQGHPVYGKKAFAKLMGKVETSGWEGKLKWEPFFSEVSAANDLGYTLGRYELPIEKTDEKQDQKKAYCYYQTIWKKQPDGKWKVAVSQGLIRLTGLTQSPPGDDRKIDESAVNKITREVLETERTFAKHAMAKGILEAFYKFIADNGKVLGGALPRPPRTKEFYAKSIAAAKEKKQPDSQKATLEWEPWFSFVSSSADLAYNYGPYKTTITDVTGSKQSYYGYFLTVWKKQPDNSWKFVVDGGNQCPPPGKNQFP